MNDEARRIGRDRISRLFQFVRALNELRNPIARHLKEMPWSLSLADLPLHDCVVLGAAPRPSSSDDQCEESSDDFVLRVKRPPPLEPIPLPPHEIIEWLEDGWQKYDGTVSVRETRAKDAGDGTRELEIFADDTLRVEALSRWNAIRESFLAEHLPAIKAFRLFERLYELRGALERDAERYDVMVGDGVLCWSVPGGSIRFPIVTQRLELEFDPNVPSFTLRDASNPTELYSALFRSIETVDGAIVGQIKKELEDGQYHPLSADDLTAFLKSIPPRLSASGRFLNDPAITETTEPTLHRSPVIFLRKRTLGIAEALDRIVSDIASNGELSQSLLNIVGEGTLAPSADLVRDDRGSAIITASEGVLFTKTANEEQYRIAEALASHACVLVQGPPGTGKTHTIANLLGHLLAEGKSVLVTSSTTKALRVLREKVVDRLQALCVSVLESDARSNDQLKMAIDSIVDRLSSATEVSLLRQVECLNAERATALTDVENTRRRLLDGRNKDLQPLSVGSDSYRPLDAAKIVSRGSDNDSWIPGPVLSGSALTVSPEEIRTLYRTNATVPTSVEIELAKALPNPAELPSPSLFAEVVEEIIQIGRSNNTGSQYWQGFDLDSSSLDALTGIALALPEIVQQWNGAPDWLFAVGHDGLRGGGHTEAWSSLFQLVSELQHLCAESKEPLTRHGPLLSRDGDIAEQHQYLSELVVHLRAGGNLRFWALLPKPKWKALLQTVTVNGRRAQSIEEIEALHLLASIESKRSFLRVRWSRQVEAIGGPALPAVNPEEAASHLIKTIQSAIAWSDSALRPLQSGLVAQGFDWSRAGHDMTIISEAQAAFRAQVRLCQEAIPPAVDFRLKEFRLRQLNAEIQNLENKLASFSGETTERLLGAVKARSPETYLSSFGALQMLFASMEELRLRREILSKLANVAPAWASAVAKRLEKHGNNTPPGDVSSAWLWTQLAQQLEERDAVPVTELQREFRLKSDLLAQKTADLADARAWLAQRKRTGLAQQQALAGWQQAIRKIGKGTGKRVPSLRRHARDLMDQAKTAVPVWIMPMIRVAENYDPQNTRFDVVIIDEASQSDVTGLMAFYFGRQIVVVGDDEQVSPEAVGQRIDETQHLIDEYLYGIPNDKLYDGKSSIYDLAKQAFGGTICLKEHFRCVPDIIQFSNHLSYSDKLIPLREASESALLPHVVEHYVNGASTHRVNEGEAEEIVALIMACLEQPEYAGKSLGVISLVGDEQAAIIETKLRRRVEPALLEERRLLCGNSAHFQGGERDVIFLSMVDSSIGAPLRLRDDPMFKKRFNVAASRARDQMWVVHSLDISNLQATDLRRRLIEHARNPKALQVKIEAVSTKAESEFERDVLAQLVTAGYRVKPQYVVGPYRIDILVEGGLRRLAVECDGEQFHTILELQRDMERQSQLERVGMTFHRIRGSRYYRDREGEFRMLIERLSEMGIEPEASSIDPPADAGEMLSRVRARATEIRLDRQDDHDIEYYRQQWSSTKRVTIDDLKPTGRNSSQEAAPAQEDRRRPRAADASEKRVFDESQASSLFGGPISVTLPLESTVDGRKGYPEHSGSPQQPGSLPNKTGRTDKTIESLLRSGIEKNCIIDKREHAGGALWVIADRSKREVFDALALQGVRFVFAPGGGRATGHKPAWWTRHR